MKRLVALRIANATIGVTLALNAVVFAASEEFVWRDRWNHQGERFKTGYIVGVYDVLQSLLVYTYSPVSGLLETNLRDAHNCINQFDNVQAAFEFSHNAISAQRNPKMMAAPVILHSFIKCDPTEVFPETLGSAVGGFVWKDRWDRDVMDFFGPKEGKVGTSSYKISISSYNSGYVAGVADLVRYLNSSGKAHTFLIQSIRAAANCDSGRTNIQLADFVRKSIESPAHDDPLESTSAAIFEALRVCKKP